MERDEFEKVLTEHGMEAERPEVGHCDPAGQLVHADCPPIEYVPASQRVDELDNVEAQAWLAGQAVHTD